MITLFAAEANSRRGRSTTAEASDRLLNGGLGNPVEKSSTAGGGKKRGSGRKTAH
jgi:hypothetical protein